MQGSILYARIWSSQMETTDKGSLYLLYLQWNEDAGDTGYDAKVVAVETVRSMEQGEQDAYGLGEGSKPPQVGMNTYELSNWTFYDCSGQGGNEVYHEISLFADTQFKPRLLRSQVVTNLITAASMLRHDPRTQPLWEKGPCEDKELRKAVTIAKLRVMQKILADGGQE